MIPYHTNNCRDGWGCDKDCPVRWLVEERQRWRKLAYLFDTHYVCDNCKSKAASYLDDCTNPLHEIHEAVYTEWTKKK